jgi:small subunit ribosomal protein S20
LSKVVYRLLTYRTRALYHIASSVAFDKWRFVVTVIGSFNMPNTKSAERRMRGSARKQNRNHSIKTRLKTLERNYLELLKAGDKGKAEAAYRQVSSSLDKAAKTGVIHSGTASRKKSRLSVRLAATAVAK